VARLRCAGTTSSPKAGFQVDQSQINDRRFASLMQSAQDGDAAAFSLLLRDITPLLRRAVTRRSWTLHPQNGEDIVQEILLSVHTARATYDPERAFLPWLMAIARNRVADAARRSARQSAHEIAVEHLPEICSEREPHDGLSPYGDSEQLRQAIQLLPGGQRKAVELLKLRELSLKEAAAATGMSIGALKVAVHRAIRTLGTVLSKEV
jgi:RNA polymerase sigma factor (sigma-70 family)